jgi:hypothetical protein
VGAVPAGAGGQPPVVLTTVTNMIQLRGWLQGVVRGGFVFRGAGGESGIVAGGMADFRSVGSHFDHSSLSYCSFCPESAGPMRAVMRRLPPVRRV